MNAPKPATPLPWESPGWDGDARIICASPKGKRRTLAHIEDMPDIGVSADANATYIVAACNAYPQLVADRARLIAALQKTNELVARGHVEGAYNAIAAGPQYAERVMAATASLLRELGEG